MLGIKLGPEEYPPVELMNYAIAAEQAGFDAIDVSDHFHPWSELGQSCFTWTWLGAAAARTNRILLGPGVTCPILRYHPAVIAQAAATVDNFAPGRTYLGVGTGEALNEYSATGTWPGYSDRQQMLFEAIELIRRLWEGGYVTFDGAFYSTRKARLYTPPTTRIPIIVSSLVPGSAAFAGLQGDGLITVASEMSIIRQIVENFESGATQAGKDPEKMPRMIELNVIYASDMQAVMQDFKKYWAGAMVPALFNQNIYTPYMSEMNGAIVGDDTLKKRLCISNDPEEHIKYIQQFIDLGFTHIYVHTAGPGQIDFIKSYARDVLPALREQNKGAAGATEATA
ncbi:TIGR03557 family F420-dependent LLM class oxidoreductase [Methanocella arvoryzae]|nr:TIGR03557 family F420-dependent LLM class oxidoreductase [Methanocella arvoryzae]